MGSVAKKQHLFSDYQNIIVDECHLVNPEDGMYSSFIRSFDKVKVLGLTATPYRFILNSNVCCSQDQPCRWHSITKWLAV